MSAAPALILHATALARRVEGRWAAVLLQAPSGGGKSTLALQALRQGWRLVADDRVMLFASGRTLFARAPEPLRGLLEARGLDILSVAPVPLAQARLLVRLEAPRARLPEPEHETLLDVALPRLSLDRDDPALLDKAAAALCRARA